MTIEQLKEQLRKMEVGGDTFIHPVKMPPEQVDKILDEFGSAEQINEDWNGCDLDWSQDIEFESMTFSTWGSGYSGSMCFQREE